MDIDTTLRVTYSHPSLPLCGTMKGRLQHDPMEGKVVFIPDKAHAEDVLSYGYEPEGGLFLEGAMVYTASDGRFSALTPAKAFNILDNWVIR